MRRNIIFSILLLLLLAVSGCTSKNDVKVYEDTEDAILSHTEVSVTAVILSMDFEQNIVQIKDCRTGVEHSLLYHGGVSVTSKTGKEVSLEKLGTGSVIDAVYYEDTAKLVSIAENKNSSTISSVTKFSANVNSAKATYKGTSCAMSDYVVAINHDGSVMDISEVNTEDKVTLHMYGGKLVAVVVDEGHGYVRLSNQDTYVGGMVEIGYDVIVPVTDDMLLAVREGEYTLRISNRGYSQSKEVTVKKDTETLVNLADIAIPSGTAVFNVEPADATVYIGGEEITGYTYTATYGKYSIRVEAEGYTTYKGSFKISDTVNEFDITLSEEETTEDTSDTTESTDTTEEQQTASSGDATSETTTESTTTEATTEEATEEATDETTEVDDTQVVDDDYTTEQGIETDNVITINTPALAGVYVDGDYLGLAPISFPKVTGTHTVTLYRSGYLIKSYTIQAEDDGKDDVYNFAELTTLLDLIE